MTIREFAKRIYPEVTERQLQMLEWLDGERSGIVLYPPRSGKSMVYKMYKEYVKHERNQG